MNVSIPRINNTDEASAATFNRPLSVIENYLSAIKASIYTIGDKGSIIAKDVRMDNSCFKGCLVYFDSDNCIFRPASASVESETISIGSDMVSPKALVCGMVVGIESSGVGSILVAGKFTSSACVTACLVEGSPGTYYLSSKADEEGRATLNPKGPIKQPILTYMGDGTFILNITHQPPYQYNGNALRGVSTSGPLTASITDGVVQLSVKELEQSGTQYSPTAIGSINGTTYTTTPVLTNIIGVGDSIRVYKNELGEAYIGLPEDIGGSVEAYEYNMNGSKRVSGDVYTFIVFPGGKTSAVTINRHIAPTNTIDVGVWLQSMSESSVDTRISMYFLEDPEEGSRVPLANTPDSEFTLTVEGSNNLVTITSSDDKIPVTGPGIVSATIEVSPSDDFRVIRAGFSIQPSETTRIELDRLLSRESLASSGLAGEDISKDSVVSIDDSGNIVKASCANPDLPACGIAIESSAAGTMCKYTTLGTHTTSITLNRGSAYFVGVDGDITTSSPEPPNYTQYVGTAVSTNTLYIDFEEAIE